MHLSLSLIYYTNSTSLCRVRSGNGCMQRG